MRSYWLFLSIAYMSLNLAAPAAQAQDTNTAELIKQLQKRIEDLERKVKTLESGKSTEPTPDSKSNQRIEDLDQKIKILERKRELDSEAAEAKAKELPEVKLGPEGFSLASADNSFAIQLKGVLQVDSRTFFKAAK